MKKADPQTKYKNHDIHIEDISQRDLDQIKSYAINEFVTTSKSSQVPLIIDSFMCYLSSNGYRITKEEKDED